MNKPPNRYQLSLRFKWNNGKEFWYDWKRYKSSGGAKHAFKDVYATLKGIIIGAEILPQGKIRDTSDNSVSIIGI